MTSTNIIELEYHGNFAIFRFNRPDVHNAINEEMMTQWEAHLDSIEADSQIRAIIITGKGKDSFCAGGDLKYFATLNNKKTCMEMSNRMQALINRLAMMGKFVVAAINGQALGGGCEISVACHYRIAASNATFAFRQAPNGIITGWGGGKRILNLVGKSSALRFLLTGERIDAQEALRTGLVNQVVEPDALLPAAEDLVRKINRNPQESIEAFLKMVNIIENGNASDLIKFETETFPELFLGEYFQNILKNYITTTTS